MHMICDFFCLLRISCIIVTWRAWSHLAMLPLHSGAFCRHHCGQTHVCVVQRLPTGLLQDSQPCGQEAVCPVSQRSGQHHRQPGQIYQGTPGKVHLAFITALLMTLEWQALPYSVCLMWIIYWRFSFFFFFRLWMERLTRRTERSAELPLVLSSKLWTTSLLLPPIQSLPVFQLKLALRFVLYLALTCTPSQMCNKALIYMSLCRLL